MRFLYVFNVSVIVEYNNTLKKTGLNMLNLKKSLMMRICCTIPTRLHYALRNIQNHILLKPNNRLLLPSLFEKRKSWKSVSPNEYTPLPVPRSRSNPHTSTTLNLPTRARVKFHLFTPTRQAYRQLFLSLSLSFSPVSHSGKHLHNERKAETERIRRAREKKTKTEFYTHRASENKRPRCVYT